MPLNPDLSLVVQVFALFFQTRWLVRWQQQWLQQHPLPPRPPRPKAGDSRTRKQRPKKQPRGTPPSRFYQRIFSLRVTLWYLLFQRLNFDHSLGAVLVDVRRGGANRLGPKGRKLSQRVRSTQTSAYSQARQRLPLELLVAALAHLRQAVVKLVGGEPAPRQKPAPDQRTRQLLDGSTLAVLLTPLLAQAYPPASNQQGQSDWCLLRIVVGFCARSGAVLSAIEGAVQQSEQTLAWALMAGASAFTLWIGDRNFGVWSVVAKAVSCDQDVLVRLTRARAAKLCRGRLLSSGQERPLDWSPSRHDRLPPDTERKPVSGRLIYVRLHKGTHWIDLWLLYGLEPSFGG